LVFHFLQFLQAGSHPTRSDRLLILAHLMTSWISQMLRMSPLRILSRRLLPVVILIKILHSISFHDLNRRLVMIVSAVSMAAFGRLSL